MAITAILSTIIITTITSITSSVSALTYQDSVDVSFTFDPTLSISLSSNNISIDNLMPGNYGHSNTITINVSTNNVYGYTLTAKVGEDGGDTGTSASSDLVNTSSNTPFTSLSSNERIKLTSFNDNTWGYTIANAITGSSLYSGLLYNTDTTINATKNSTGTPAGSYTGGNTTNFTIGAKASSSQLAGEYTNTLVFTTVASNIIPSYTLYDVVANLNKGKQTALDLKQPITTPTSSNPFADTSNSGVYEYDPEVFGVASDASNDYKIYYYRGILDSAFASTDSYGNIGSSGNGGYYPNYVRLGNTCWRIVRTTGSGGVKMIYNGLYSTGTVANSCANATSNAQAGSVAFNSVNSGRTIISAGYTYDAKQKGITSNISYGTLFGTNENYSDNTTNSTIKNYIENTWFTGSKGVGIYENILESSAGYCNDRSIYSSGAIMDDDAIVVEPYSGTYSENTDTQYYYFSARMRTWTTSGRPSLTCFRNEADLYTTDNALDGNRQLLKPAVLLTVDEMTLAGSGRGDASSSYDVGSYLRTGASFFLLSPNRRMSDGYVRISVLNADGHSDYYYTLNPRGVRPVISLVHDTIPTAGSGTATDPWIIAAP